MLCHSEQLSLPFMPAWRVTIAPRDDGRIGVQITGEGWTVAASYPTRAAARRGGDA